MEFFIKIASLIAVAILTFSVSAEAHEAESICGAEDDRKPSKVKPVGRIQQYSAPAGCTVTMIGKTCAVSAGHCTSTFQIAEFNTKASDEQGKIRHSYFWNIYPVVKESIKSVNGGPGNDWAVLRLDKNWFTRRYPGQRQGFYKVSFKSPAKGDVIRISGYGRDYNDPTRNFAQQTHTGEIASLSGSLMRHVADTTGGNSGSSVINTHTGKIVGIHTHAGCSPFGGSNQSTLIATHKKFQAAIKACLAWEKKNL